MNQAPLQVLVVEDNPGDVVLLAEAVERAGSAVHLHVTENGQEALAFLERREPHAAAPRPSLIVLDLNLPIMSGREVLAVLAATPAFHDIPVAVLTTSRIESGICEGYPRGNCRYFIKSAEFRELVKIVQEMVRFANAAGTDAGGTGEAR